jgi:hypothetical protein
VNHRLAAACLALLFSAPALAQEQPAITFVNSIKLETINNDGVLDLAPLGAAPGDWIFVVGAARLVGASMNITGGPGGDWRLVATQEKWNPEEQATLGMRGWLLRAASGSEGATRFFTFTGAVIHTAVVFHAYAFRPTTGTSVDADVGDLFDTETTLDVTISAPAEPLPWVVVNAVAAFDGQDLVHEFQVSGTTSEPLKGMQGELKVSSAYAIYPLDSEPENIPVLASTSASGPKAVIAAVLRLVH